MAAKADATQPFNPMFPNAVARDPCLSPVGLFLAAYRSTFAGKYKLIPHRLGHLARRGLGKNAATAGIAEMRAAGVLKRWQPPGPPGAFCEVEEELCLPEGNGRFVSRAWFDGKLDVAEMAALIFLRAGTGRGPKTYRRELQKRFGWAPGTARRVIDGLMGRSLLDKTVRRKADGTHLSTTYTVPKLAADMLARSGVQNSGNANSSTAQKPGDTNPGRANPGRANPGRANPGNYTYTPPYEPPSEDSPHVLPSAECPHAPDQGLEKYAFRASRGLAPTISDLKLDKLHQVAQAESDLLGWIGVSDGVSEAVFEDAPSDEATRAVYEVVSDSKLREALRQATDQRIAYVLLEPAGLYTVRWLAAFLMSKAEETADGDSVPITPIEALASVIDAIWARIGDQPGEWLNSYALIGKRLAANLYGGWMPRAGLCTSQGKKAALDNILEADGARTLSPRLRRDAEGFHIFVQKQSNLHRINGSAYPAEVESIIANRLRQHMIDGRPVGSIKSWRYFEAHIAEEMDRMRAREWKEGKDDDAQAHP